MAGLRHRDILDDQGMADLVKHRRLHGLLHLPFLPELSRATAHSRRTHGRQQARGLVSARADGDMWPRNSSEGAMTETIGFIGLGRMGRPMASNLCRKGFRVIAYDINPAAVAELEQLQARGADEHRRSRASNPRSSSPCCPTRQRCARSSAAADGVIANARSGIAHRRHEHGRSRDHRSCRASSRATKGMGFVDAPVGRLAAHAERGESLFMVGGSAEDFARAKPALEAMGTTIFHCGDVGAGHAQQARQQLSRDHPLPAQCRGLGIVAALRARSRTHARCAARHDGDQRPAQDQLAEQGAQRRYRTGLHHRSRA